MLNSWMASRYSLMSAQLQKHSNPNYQIDRPTLTLRQKRFIRYYVETLNATKAARLAGYSGNAVTLASVGCENLRKPQIVAEINRLCNPIADAEEVLQRLTKHSRARISDVLTDTGEFDLQTAKDNDADDLIKKLKFRKTRRTTPQGETIEEVTQDVELHDAQTATVQLARVHKLLTDRVEVEQVSDPRKLAQEMLSALAELRQQQQQQQKVLTNSNGDCAASDE